MRRLKPQVAAVIACLVIAGGVIAGVNLTSGGTPQAATGSVHPSGWGATPKGFVSPSLLTAVPTETMFDAVTVGNIPGGPYAVAGYTAGNWPTYETLLRDFPSAHHISIAIQASLHADCLDVEPGDASAFQAGAWAKADIAAGFPKPCLYSDLSNMPAVKASLAAAGLARSRYLLWLAWYRNTPGLVAGYDAVQYSESCLGRNLDCSTVSLPFLTIAQPPYVAPKPKPPLPVCIHRREASATCAAAKAKIASDQRAAASSQRALTATDNVLAAAKCRRPFRRGVCVKNGRSAGVFAQRVKFFEAAAAKLEQAN